MLVALVTASAVALAAIYLAHGFNHRSTVAYLGTAAALVLTGVLASVFVEACNFTGLADEEATFRRSARPRSTSAASCWPGS